MICPAMDDPYWASYSALVGLMGLAVFALRFYTEGRQ